jgi:predicted DNA repair protein MutK
MNGIHSADQGHAITNFRNERIMHIAVVGWIYVVLMMSVVEESFVAGIMTFFLYGVLPVSIILYIGGTGRRRRRREQERLREREIQERQQMVQEDKGEGA